MDDPLGQAARAEAERRAAGGDTPRGDCLPAWRVLVEAEADVRALAPWWTFHGGTCTACAATLDRVAAENADVSAWLRHLRDDARATRRLTLLRGDAPGRATWAAAAPVTSRDPSAPLPQVWFHGLRVDAGAGTRAAWIVEWDDRCLLVLEPDPESVARWASGAAAVGPRAEVVARFVPADDGTKRAIAGGAGGKVCLESEEPLPRAPSAAFTIPGLLADVVTIEPLAAHEPRDAGFRSLVVDMVRRNRVAAFLEAVAATTVLPEEERASACFYLRWLSESGRVPEGVRARLRERAWIDEPTHAALASGLRPDGALRVPLLFWRPGSAMVPLLDVALAPRGGGAVHASVRRPVEHADQSLEPRGTSLLAALLPRFAGLDHYTCGYHLPPRDVDLFVDEFPRGSSHLLCVLLACYALGADHVLGGTEFRDAMDGWTATGSPGKDGRIGEVTGLREKLQAVLREREEVVQSGGPHVRCVLVPRDNEDEARAIGTSDAAGAITLAGSDGPPLRVVPVARFDDALEAVFGRERLARYARRNRLHRIASATWTRTAVAAAAVLLVVALAVVVFRRTRDVAGAHPGADPDLRPFDATRPLTDHDAGASVVIEYADGGYSSIGPLGARVCSATVERDAEDRAVAVLVGLERPGPNAGVVLRLERDIVGSWVVVGRTDPWRELAREDADRAARGVQFLAIADLDPGEPGPETLACITSDGDGALLALLSRDGRVVRGLWHGGSIEGMTALAGPPRVLAWGCANHLPSERETTDAWFGTPAALQAKDPCALEHDPAHAFDRVLFSIRSEKLEGRSPFGAWAVPETVGSASLSVAAFDFYERFTPKGYRVRRFEQDFPDPAPGADIVISVTGYRLDLAADGRIVRVTRGPDAGDAPTPSLEPVREH